MSRPGGWVLGLIAAAAIVGAGWLAIRPLRNRETLILVVNRGARDPSSDAIISGMRFALAEAGSRAGTFHIELREGRHSSPAKGRIQIDIGRDALLEARVEEPEPGLSPDHSVQPLPLRPVPDLRDLGIAAARWARESGARTPVLLRDKGDARSFTIAHAFQEGTPLALPPLDDDPGEGPPPDPGRLKALVESVIAARPDLVFYAGEEAPYGRAFEIFDALRKGGYTGRLAMGDSDPEVSYLAVPTQVVEGTLLISPIGPPSPEFAAAYEPSTGRRAGPHAWPGYVAMKELLLVLDHASSSHRAHLTSLFNQAVRIPPPCAVYVAREGKFVFDRELK